MADKDPESRKEKNNPELISLKFFNVKFARAFRRNDSRLLIASNTFVKIRIF